MWFLLYLLEVMQNIKDFIQNFKGLLREGGGGEGGGGETPGEKLLGPIPELIISVILMAIFVLHETW